MVRIVKKVLVAIAWLLLWQLASHLVALPVLLPSPIATVRTMTALWGTSSFWSSLSISFVRVAFGMAAAITLGVLIAVLCAASSWAEAFLSPLRSVIRSTPITSIIILVLLWIRVDLVPVFIVFLTVLPIIWQTVQQGIIQTDKDLLEMGRVYAFSRTKLLRKIYVPSVLPYFYTACATGLGFAWKASIAAEVIARPIHSIGVRLQDAKVYLQTEQLFAWTATVILISILLETALKAWMRRQTRHGGGAAS